MNGRRTRALAGIVGTGLAAAIAIAPAAQAKTHVVTREGDSGRGTLRGAIEKVDRGPGRDRIEFARRVHDIRLRSDLQIGSPVTIDGSGRRRLTLIGRGKKGSIVRFATEGDGRLQIRDLATRQVGIKVDGYDADDIDVVLKRLRLDGGGRVGAGVSYLEGYSHGDLRVADTTISGFDIGVDVDKASVEIESSKLRRNRTGVLAISSFARIHNSTVSGNVGGGGVVVDYYGGAAISKSTISGNVAEPVQGGPGKGGGVDAGYEAFAGIVNSTISGNSAQGTGSRGGGIYGNVEVTASTITANAAEEGGGIYAYHAQEPGPITFEDSILAGNSAVSGPDCAGETPLVSKGHNLIGAACGATLPTDLIGVDPLLEPLAKNGGPTRTHALAAGSPAIGAAKDVGLDTDQRGFRRDGEPDIGAFERRPKDG
jgi:hypothetical protein